MPPTPHHARGSAGLNLDLVVQLVLKHLHFSGELTGIEMSRRLGVDFSVVEPALTSQAPSPGRNRRRRLHRRPVVPLSHHRRRPRTRAAVSREQPVRRCRAGAARRSTWRTERAIGTPMPRSITRERVREAFSHLVLSERVLDQVGPAIRPPTRCSSTARPATARRSSHRRFGTCSTARSRFRTRIEVEGSIIRLFDPVNHEPIDAGRDRRQASRDPTSTTRAGSAAIGRW